MQAVIHVGKESELYVKLLVQKRVDLAIKIVETWQKEQLKALLTEWKKVDRLQLSRQKYEGHVTIYIIGGKHA